jgi:hypothetical protein
VNGKCISASWAGLLTIGQGPYTVVQAFWKQPTTPTLVPELYAATGIWVGLGGGKSGDAVPVQVGTLMTTGPEGWCSFKPCYSAVYETPATGRAVTIPGFKIRPGDTMAALVDYVHDDFQMYLTDVTTGQRWSSGTIHKNYSLDTAEIAVELPKSIIPEPAYGLAPFKSVQFYNLGIRGSYALQMVSGNRTLVSTSLPSVIVTYHHSS